MSIAAVKNFALSYGKKIFQETSEKLFFKGLLEPKRKLKRG